MKPSLALRRFLLASATLAAVNSAHAQIYWDTNDTTAGFRTASGTWATDAFWNDDATGGAGTFTDTTATTDSLNFGTATAGLGAGTKNFARLVVTGP